MPSYAYNDGDGLTVFDKTVPNGAVEPVSNLDDAIKQIKAYMKDPVVGLAKMQADLTGNVSGLGTLSNTVTGHTTSINNLTTRVGTLESEIGAAPAAANFIAQLTGAQVTAASSSYVLMQFNNALRNVGSGFSISTYKFTAPVAGLYNFLASLKTFTSASAAPTGILHFLSLFKNGVEYATKEHSFLTDTRGAHMQLARYMVLAQNDVIDVRYKITITGGTMSSDSVADGVGSEFSGMFVSV